MRLVATSGDQMLSFPLRQGSTLIGRHPSCHVCIPAKGLSRRHCQCFVDGTRVIVRDLGSSNGTFVNNSRIDRTELRDGDLIVLGGFQLRFDSEGAMPATGAAFMQGAQATEEVIVAETTDADPRGPAEAFVDASPPPMDDYLDAEGPIVGEGVPPPSDFPDSPDGEETPVDNAFVPAPYTGAQTFGVAQQPQLVVRDGRWFLRDPHTGREVEIAPRDGSAAVAAPAEARRPNTKLLLTVVGAAVAVVLAFAFFVLSPAGPKPNGKPRVPVAEFRRVENLGIGLIRKANQEKSWKKRLPLLEEAVDKLGKADAARPDIGSARLFASYAKLRIEAGGDLAKLNWGEVDRLLESVTRVFSGSQEAYGFAQEENRRIQYEVLYLGRGAELMIRAQRDGSEETLKDVLKGLAGLPEDTFAHTRYKADAAKIRRILLDSNTSRADQAMTSQKWEEAIRFLQDAKPFTDDAASLDKQIARCQKSMAERDQLAQGKQEYESENFAAARGLFQGIPEDSPYRDEAQNYITRIDRGAEARAHKALVKQIQDLYREGAGDKAAKLIAEKGVQELAYIPERVKRITELIAAGKAAEKIDDFRKAQLCYQQAVEVEPDADNAYHKEAAALLTDLKGRYTEIGAKFVGKGNPIKHTDPVGARKAFEEALHWDPENKQALRSLVQLDRMASSLYNQADQFIREDRPDKALESLERALAYAKPDGELHSRIKQRMEELK